MTCCSTRPHDDIGKYLVLRPPDLPQPGFRQRPKPIPRIRSTAASSWPTHSAITPITARAHLRAHRLRSTPRLVVGAVRAASSQASACGESPGMMGIGLCHKRIQALSGLAVLLLRGRLLEAPMGCLLRAVAAQTSRTNVFTAQLASACCRGSVKSTGTLRGVKCLDMNGWRRSNHGFVDTRQRRAVTPLQYCH